MNAADAFREWLIEHVQTDQVDAVLASARHGKSVGRAHVMTWLHAGGLVAPTGCGRPRAAIQPELARALAVLSNWGITRGQVSTAKVGDLKTENGAKHWHLREMGGYVKARKLCLEDVPVLVDALRVLVRANRPESTKPESDEPLLVGADGKRWSVWQIRRLTRIGKDLNETNMEGAHEHSESNSVGD